MLFVSFPSLKTKFWRQISEEDTPCHHSLIKVHVQPILNHEICLKMSSSNIILLSIPRKSFAIWFHSIRLSRFSGPGTQLTGIQVRCEATASRSGEKSILKARFPRPCKVGTGVIVTVTLGKVGKFVINTFIDPHLHNHSANNWKINIRCASSHQSVSLWLISGAGRDPFEDNEIIQLRLISGTLW